MEKYNVTGMSCAACSARVEKAVSQVEGVSCCAVNLLTNSMIVEGSATSEAIISAVTQAGYGAFLASGEMKKEKGADALKDRETPAMVKRLVASVILLLPLMYVSMGHAMWNFPLPKVLSENCIAIGLLQLLLAAAVMVVNQKFFINGFRGVIHGAPNMDTLVALGSAASFLYSVYALFAMSGCVIKGDISGAHGYMHEFYFESAAMILTLITVGKLLEAKSKGRTTDAIRSLMKLAPQKARITVDGEEKEIPIEELRAGDLFIVKPGESIPADGRIVSGGGAVNEAALTGESIPVDKNEGDSVYAATVNQSGYLVCSATGVGEDTTLSQIIQMVSDASATKAPIAKIADKVSGVFVPAVMAIAVITFIVWLSVGAQVGYALARGVSVLVISCPCALGLATPVAVMVGNGVAAKHGIMFKTAVSLEQTGKTQIAVLDKTGTVTKGEPKVCDIVTAEGVDEKELLYTAYSLEKMSEHPLARAIVKEAEEKELDAGEVTDFSAHPGGGIEGIVCGKRCSGGNRAFAESRGVFADELDDTVDIFSSEGKTPLIFEKEGKLLGIIAVADTVKEDSAAAVAQLKNMGIRVVMLTGDNRGTAEAVGNAVGIDEIISDVKPDMKEAAVRRLQEEGRVAMIGDGINDAPALTRADVGIAIGAGTDIAIDAADVVLMKSSLCDAAAAVRISRRTLKTIHENLFWAFIYNIIGIPLAAGVWIHAFGWTLNPMFGAAAMSLSSFCVVTNALRLNLCRPYDDRRDRKASVNNKRKKNKKEKEKKNMVISVKGMMCPHCEAHAKEALEGIDGVVSAVADHKEAKVTLEVSAPVAEGDIKAAVEKAGYEYAGIIE